MNADDKFSTGFDMMTRAFSAIDDILMREYDYIKDNPSDEHSMGVFEDLTSVAKKSIAFSNGFCRKLWGSKSKKNYC